MGENRHLLTDLMRAQESYQELLRQSLSEQRLHLQMLSNSLAASSLSREPVQRQSGVVDLQPDPELVEWLEGLKLNQESMDRILNEDLTLNDMLELMSMEGHAHPSQSATHPNPIRIAYCLFFEKPKNLAS